MSQEKGERDWQYSVITYLYYMQCGLVLFENGLIFTKNLYCKCKLTIKKFKKKYFSYFQERW